MQDYVNGKIRLLGSILGPDYVIHYTKVEALENFILQIYADGMEDNI